MSRLLVAVFVGTLLFLPCCGGGSGDSSSTGTIVAGPLVMALPFLPTSSGESFALNLRNLSNSAGTVTVTAFTPTAGVYPGRAPVPVPLDPQGGAELPLALFTGASAQLGGWLEVETRDPTMLDAVTGEPTPTAVSGFVAASMQRAATGLETDSALGAAFRDTFAYVSVNPNTVAWQVVNRSFTPAAGGATPSAVDVDITIYDAFGAEATTSTETLAANGSILLVPTVDTGRVEILPAATVPATTEVRLAAAGLEADPQVFIEARFLDVSRPLGQRFVGLDLEFGRDLLTGNVFDFGVLVTNPSDSEVTIALEQITLQNGQSLLASPRLVGLDAKATKFLATNQLDSRGLDTGEVTPFLDIFGDVGLATSVDVVTVAFSVPPEASISARGYNSFKSFHRILPGRKLTTDVMVTGVHVPTTTVTGARNYIPLMNPRANAIDVNIFGYTPGGTEYIVDTITVGGYQRFDWSPDGTTYTEDPTDVTAPPVPFMAFRLTASGGIFFDGRRERAGLDELIMAIVPHPVRDLRAD